MSDWRTKVESLTKERRFQEAFAIASTELNKDFDDPGLLYSVGQLCAQIGKHGISNVVLSRFLKFKPKSSEGWMAMGQCHAEVCRDHDAALCFENALKYAGNDAVNRGNALVGLALVALSMGKPDKAIDLCKEAILANRNLMDARHNMAIAHLMKREWAKGWRLYEMSVGQVKDRSDHYYSGEGKWDGSPGKTVVAFGEQGIGDEISFASCVPDMVKNTKHAIIECDSRLEGLFKRSFPEASVYGTRFKEGNDWPSKHEIDARVAFGTLPKFYRNDNESFPGTPYLVADPDLRVMYRALLDSHGDKLKVGLAWSGGLDRTNRGLRTLKLGQLLPILRHDATFISLEYKGVDEEELQVFRNEGVNIYHYPKIVEVKDYDHTAALVAELDLVICVTTAVVHLSGALGRECWAMVHKNPMWRYGLEGDTMPWYRSVKMFRQKQEGNWAPVIHEVGEALGRRIGQKIVVAA